MSKIPKPIWWLDTRCVERYFRQRSRHGFQRIDNSRLKGRLCLRYNQLFLKIAIKRHGRYFSFQNEMRHIRELRGQEWVPRFECRLEHKRYTIFAYRYYEMHNLQKLMMSKRLSARTRSLIEMQLHSIQRALRKYGLVHRDITPANLLFDESSGRLLLIDFQWARKIDSEILVNNKLEEIELSNCLSVVGNRYRIPGNSPIGFDYDSFSIRKILSELYRSVDKL